MENRGIARDKEVTFMNVNQYLKYVQKKCSPRNIRKFIACDLQICKPKDKTEFVAFMTDGLEDVPLSDDIKNEVKQALVLNTSLFYNIDTKENAYEVYNCNEQYQFVNHPRSLWSSAPYIEQYHSLMMDLGCWDRLDILTNIESYKDWGY